jgi:hypothetical protein
MATAVYFDRAANAYRNSMAQYKMTGDAASKSAADAAKQWMQYYVQWQEGLARKNTTYINKFVSDYKSTNQDLIKMQKTVKNVKDQGPKMENVYLTNKEAADDTPKDYTPYYVKGGIVLGTLVLVSVLFMRD